MADTSVEGLVSGGIDDANALWGPYWSDKDTAVIVFFDDGGDISFARTTDAGATWATTEIEAGTCKHLACWYDKETPGDTGTLVHMAWLDDADEDANYRTVDVSDGTLGTARIVDSTITVSTSVQLNRVAITKTVGGNLIYAFSTQSEIECYRSTDSGANWTARADVYETATEEDWLLLFPANTADNNDVVGLFWDRSAAEISIKMYDDSADSWTETIFATSMAEDLWALHMDGSVRHSDKRILFAAHNAKNTAGDDLLTWELDVSSIASPTATAKANVFTNQDDSGRVAVHINQQNDDVRIAYPKGNPSWESTTIPVLHKSTDGMASWETEQDYGETTDDNRNISMGRTVGNDGGRIQPVFYNDDLTEIFVNLVNDTEIAAALAGTPLHYYERRRNM